MGRYVKRASRQKIAWFHKKAAPLIEERRQAGYTVCEAVPARIGTIRIAHFLALPRRECHY